jgi:hypothetical protein
VDSQRRYLPHLDSIARHKMGIQGRHLQTSGHPIWISMSSEDSNSFLNARILYKFKYWVTQRINYTGHAVIGNDILVSSTFFFLGVWGVQNGKLTKSQHSYPNYELTWKNLDTLGWRRIYVAFRKRMVAWVWSTPKKP